MRKKANVDGGSGAGTFTHTRPRECNNGYDKNNRHDYLLFKKDTSFKREIPAGKENTSNSSQLEADLTHPDLSQFDRTLDSKFKSITDTDDPVVLAY